MTKVTINNVGSLIDSTTAQTTINNNNAVIQTAFDNTLSRDGTNPNTMGSNLDMNSYRIVNLTDGISAQEPVTLQQLNTLIGGGTITTGGVPNGGVTNAALIKQSATNQNTIWSTPTGTGNSVYSISPTIASPNLTTPTLGVANPTTAGTVAYNAGTINYGDGVANHALVGVDVSQTLTNKTYDTAGTGNVFKINGTPITANTGTGNNVLSTSPTLVTPVLGVATATSVGATAGITSSGGGVGYATGAGGTVTQITSKSTPVTLNSLTGTIATSNATMAAGSLATFVFTNSFIAATDLIVCSYSAPSLPSDYIINFTATGTGTANCEIRNVSGSLTPAEVITIRFAIIKSVNS